ncbi:hypothetical protein F3Y22_tig00111303pilonHSYRG00061 [Hibiscus syriacus]|uniref:PB1 domain-containing protein n=1 Tax=Hibiscus syriacus TaxID=106335 RepID=A0A6A2YQZ8_HIBSY|nr:hypothetical protein F3Y22_tig00111303pilonHSYRG00061 [Hibiscus syriacus]
MVLTWRLRQKGDNAMLYDHEDEKFYVVCHYGGSFVHSPRMKFTGNKIAYFDLCDCDTISLLDFCEMMEQILVPTLLQLFWLLPNAKLTESSIMPLGTDSDVMKMVQSLPRNRYIRIYAQVKGITESGCYESGGVEVDNAESGGVEMDNAESGGAEIDTVEMGSVERDNAEMGSVERGNAESGGVEMDSAESTGVEMDNAKMGSVERDNVEMGSVERDNVEMGSVERDNVESVGVEMDNVEMSNVEMSNVERDNEKDKSSNEGVRGTEVDFEEVVVEDENNGSNESDSDFQVTDGENYFDDEESLLSMVEEDVINILGDMGRHEFNNRSDEMFDSSPVNSGELNSDRDSDSDARLTFPEFNKETDMENLNFQKGMLFCSKETLQEAIRQYGRVNRTVVLFKVNDNKRLQAICREGCPWKLWASPLHSHDFDSNTWQIKTYESEHTCAKLLKNKNVSYRFIGMKYIQKFMSDMNYSLTSLKQDVMTDYGTVCSLTKCGRAREHALEMIQGKLKEQYGNIYEYLLELRNINVGTTTVCKLDNRLFQRMYVCLQAYKEGFQAGCKRIISLDGCFLKGYYAGYLLAAVGTDANGGIYPIAYAVVEKLFPNAEARNCVRHIYVNFKKDHKGKALKDALWRAARATYGREFQDAITKLKTLSNDAFEWLKHLNPQQWSKAHFSTTTKSDMLLNNLCECFNKIILEARDKPILNMMELIRTKIMRRIICRYEAAEKINGPLCPNIQKKLNIIIDQATRKWDLTGIPCIHAVAVMQLHNDRPKPYVHTCYHKSTQLAIYSNFICPVKGAKQWTPVTEMEPILPPELRRLPGRPTKKRRNKADEGNKNGPKLSKKGSMGNYSKCSKPGHNKRTCRGEVGGNRSLNQHESGSSQPHAPDQSSQHSTPMQRQARTIQPTSQQVLRPKLPTMRPLNPPTTVRWMMPPSTTDHAMPGNQESSVSNPHNQDLHTTSKE